MTTYHEVSAATGFDKGDKFADEEAVRAYFTVAEQRHMFGFSAVTDQRLLNKMAATVIEHGWHIRVTRDPDMADLIADPALTDQARDELRRHAAEVGESTGRRRRVATYTATVVVEYDPDQETAREALASYLLDNDVMTAFEVIVDEEAE